MIKKQSILIFLIYCIINCKSESNQTTKNDIALPEIQDNAAHNYRLAEIIDQKPTGLTKFSSTLILKRDGHDIRFTVTVINIFNGLIKKTGEDKFGDIYSVSDLTSTMIATYGDDEKNENYLLAAIFSLERIELSKNPDELIITSRYGQFLIFEKV